jgi:hypothetical protein
MQRMMTPITISSGNPNPNIASAGIISMSMEPAGRFGKFELERAGGIEHSICRLEAGRSGVELHSRANDRSGSYGRSQLQLGPSIPPRAHLTFLIGMINCVA